MSNNEDLLRLEYVPLSQAVLFDQNPKRHDVGLLSESIRRYGFKDPPKFEPELNNSKGGIVEGNGRIITLRMMYDQGMERPRGLAEVGDTGEWAAPILFGVDAVSEAAARAYAIDSNNLTMTGGDFNAWDMARLWDEEGYLDILRGLGEADSLPVSVDGEDLSDLLRMVTDPMAEWEGMPEFEQEDILGSALTCIVRFRTEEDRDDFERLLGVKLNHMGETWFTWFPPQDFDQLGTREGLVYHAAGEP